MLIAQLVRVSHYIGIFAKNNKIQFCVRFQMIRHLALQLLFSVLQCVDLKIILSNYLCFLVPRYN